MTSVIFDSNMTDDVRRQKLYQGELVVTRTSEAALELVNFTRQFLEDEFATSEPELAQFNMSVEDYAALLSDAKPRYIHHAECKRLLREILADFQCDPLMTYFDVPRIRSSTSDNYLTTGIAYAFHPHRDTWYSAPMTQINWWMPIYPLAEDNCMAFHPRYWSNGIRNSSEGYNYQDWNKQSRFNAAKQIGKDTRVQPKALEPIEEQPDIRLLPEPGQLILFSGAQMHSSVENTSGRTRFSIDFRTVHLDDMREGIGAPNVDSRCTGTAAGDYLRCQDLAHLPDDIIEAHMAGHTVTSQHV